jgi:predicted RNA-binding protein with PUA-like domain
MKSDPDEYSIIDLKAAPNQTDYLDGVRNYQARNFMRDDMKLGDKVYHGTT